ncbi:uncharacterized protein EDB93DRAFT_1257510 [Suillus bovinus]|uniref:uncharacterized protein n=1 Tax=Suillus bovinus TaxID=48563 RepID=UPI001B881953|nr:uncharacterized protein EDB93DRAFT_1257510 [Suillus bovinus]KAG2126561.1 hypothetical protein EDB93DRAFT_1257510 [Suillus bovinus]
MGTRRKELGALFPGDTVSHVRDAQGSNSKAQTGHSQPSQSLPFREIANLWYWSTEFATSPISDATELRKPDLVLLDYKLRKLDSSEKSWKDVLTGIEITQSDLSSDCKIPLFLGIVTKGYLIMREQPCPNNIIIYEGKGCFIDFDNAKFLDIDGQADKSLLGTGTITYILFRVLHLMGDGDSFRHMPCDDVELLFYILLEFTVMPIGPKVHWPPENWQWDAVRKWDRQSECDT